jgi:hypothetical protein
MNILHYHADGANRNAQAVLAMLQYRIGDGIEASYKDGRYRAEIEIARWSNGREQGYIAYLQNEADKTLNIAWYEHRNSDKICALAWEQTAFPNPITIETMDRSTFKNKWDVAKTVSYNEAYEMATWIYEAFDLHWAKTA